MPHNWQKDEKLGRTEASPTVKRVVDEREQSAQHCPQPWGYTLGIALFATGFFFTTNSETGDGNTPDGNNPVTNCSFYNCMLYRGYPALSVSPVAGMATLMCTEVYPGRCTMVGVQGVHIAQVPWWVCRYPSFHIPREALFPAGSLFSSQPWEKEGLSAPHCSLSPLGERRPLLTLRTLPFSQRTVHDGQHAVRTTHREAGGGIYREDTHLQRAYREVYTRRCTP